jgi:hypothetical protein
MYTLHDYWFFNITIGFNVGDLQLFMQLVLVIHINVCMHVWYGMCVACAQLKWVAMDKI